LIVIPKTATASRLAENLNIDDFSLSEEDVQKVTKFSCGLKIVNPKNFAIFGNVPLFA